MSESGNDNWQLGRNTPILVVDQLANELAQKFGNAQFYQWYCRSIYDLGPDRINEILGRVSDAKNPGRLFSHYVNQERKALQNKWKLHQKMGEHGRH